MKNKKLTYLLLVLVAVVYIYIGYRVYKAFWGKEEPVSVNLALPVAKEAVNDYAAVKDTSRLMMNYRDPFGLAKRQDTTAIRSSKLNHPQALTIVKAVNWGLIKYSGFMRNPGAKRLIALMSVNGKQVMLAEGEQAEKVKLLKNRKDSVLVSYQGKTRFIPMN